MSPRPILPESSAHQAIRAQAQARRLQHAADLDAFVSAAQPLVLEIGCGHGHFLTAYAAAHPQEWCVGADLISYRIERANRKKRLAHLENVLFLKAEAFELLEALGARRVEKLFILFADPWPKRRHHNRRLLRTQLLDEAAKHTNPGALLCFRTDDADFFKAAHACVEAHPLWGLSEEPWPFEASTFFQEMHPVYQSLIARRLPGLGEDIQPENQEELDD